MNDPVRQRQMGGTRKTRHPKITHELHLTQH